MKRSILVPILTLPLIASAQVIWEDDFESYTSGTYIAENSGGSWTTWSGMPGSTEDAYASDVQAHSGSISALFDSPGGGGPTDFVHDFGNLTTGHYSFSLWVYVEPGNGAYFNLLHLPFPPAQWAIQCYFSDDGTGTLENGPTPVVFTYTPGSWVAVIIDIDLDNDMAQAWVDGNSLGSWQWSVQSSGTAGENQLAWLNLYAAAPTGQSALYYVDDVKLEVSTIGIAETTGSTLTTFPNPVEDILTVELPQANSRNTRVTLLDATGSLVRAQASNVSAGAIFKLQIDVSTLPQGVYLLRVEDGIQVITRKVVKG